MTKVSSNQGGRERSRSRIPARRLAGSKRTNTANKHINKTGNGKKES